MEIATAGTLKAEELERMIACLRDLPTTSIKSNDQAESLIQTTIFLTKPAPENWTQGEVAKLLVHYFAGGIPERFAQSIGEDYAAELDQFPAWAIRKARRWWLSSKNGYRHRKPLPGDLSDRCKIEMGPIRYAEAAVRAFKVNGPPQPERETITPEVQAARREAANALMAEAGYSRDKSGVTTEDERQSTADVAPD